MIEKMMLWLMDSTMDASMENMLTSKYDENPFLMTTIAEKLTPRALVEAGMRAETGKAINRPLGSPIVLSPWEKMLLNPRQLFECPTEDKNTIQTTTIIGPNASKPLQLDHPIMITGMSYGGSLSLRMKMALAKGAAIAGTSTNTGESGLTTEERDSAKFLIGQYNRGMRIKDADLPHFDAIEIQFGQGAWGGGSEITDKAKNIGEHLRGTWDIEEGHDSTVFARFPNTNTSEAIINLVSEVKSKVDVPVGVKIAGSDFIEYDLEVIAETNADFIAIDGAEGGTAGAPPTLEDDVGMPTLHSIVRAVDWLNEHNVKEKYQVIAAGGLTTPGHFLKALALGADAVYIGSIALIATLQSQMVKSLPKYPPPQLALYTGKLKQDFEMNEGAKDLANFLKSCTTEMKGALQVLSKNATNQLNREDLVTFDQELAAFAGIRYGASKRNNQ